MHHAALKAVAWLASYSICSPSILYEQMLQMLKRYSISGCRSTVYNNSNRLYSKILGNPCWEGWCIGMQTVGDHLPFCSNPDCLLHVRVGDAHVMGAGNWARLADGRIVGRGI